PRLPPVGGRDRVSRGPRDGHRRATRGPPSGGTFPGTPRACAHGGLGGGRCFTCNIPGTGAPRGERGPGRPGPGRPGRGPVALPVRGVARTVWAPGRPLRRLRPGRRLRRGAGSTVGRGPSPHGRAPFGPCGAGSRAPSASRRTDPRPCRRGAPDHARRRGGVGSLSGPPVGETRHRGSRL